MENKAEKENVTNEEMKKEIKRRIDSEEKSVKWEKHFLFVKFVLRFVLFELKYI